MKALLLKTVVIVSVTLHLPNVYADMGMKGHDMDTMQSQSSAPAAMSEGEVIKIDKSRQMITLKHGPIENMKMPPMTMAFRVKEATLLNNIKAGDKVKFRLEKVKDTATVTALSVER